VESGERYVDLSAVHLTGRVEFVGDAAATARIEAAVDEKYTPKQVFLRFVPDGRMLTWDNARIPMKKS
jgi:hypothetical protein